MRRAVQALAWGLFALYLAFTVLVLALRYLILPEAGRYRPEIEQAASQALGLPVEIGTLATRWSGLNPTLELADVRILDESGAPALTLSHVEGVLSWRSLWRGAPTFARLVFERPALQIRRDADGHILVAGIAIDRPGDAQGLRWLLDQTRIRIQNATLAWEDARRPEAPPLVLEDLQFELENHGTHHRFGLNAQPPEKLSTRLDLRGDLRGRADMPLADWQGTLYTRLDYADLTALSTWIDLPESVPRGRGGVQLWFERQSSGWQATADLALRDVRLLLAAQRPALDLHRLSGRIAASQTGDRFSLRTRGLDLDAGAGLKLTGLDLAADWQGARDSSGRGTLRANTLDLAVLAGLASHLPLDETTRALLLSRAPRGRLGQLQLSWDGRTPERPRYTLQSTFSGLGLAAEGQMPGASGLAGRIEANDKGGTLELDHGAAHLELPAVFAEADIPVHRLVAKLRWDVLRDDPEPGVAVSIDRLTFSSPYADGQLRGTYRSLPDGPGRIDLDGSLSRAVASEAWRFIPKAVNADVPAWLRQGLLAGTGSDARLILKGNLKDFPFRDPARGQFLITAKAHDVTLRYGKDWPVIEGLEADMRFGVGMLIQAHAGRILGAQLGETRAELPDFESSDEILHVQGTASGPTAEFLRFIDKSPVAASINHFTDGMTAQGPGRLDLRLDLPLRRIDDSRIQGRYHFEANQIGFLAGLPPASGVSGFLDFTEKGVSTPELRGSFLGQPMQLKASSDNGLVLIKASGGLLARELARQTRLTVFEHLSGATSWQAEVKVKKRNADFLITSNLQGISSSLPAPFNKVATDSLPLRIEKTSLDARGGAREQISLTLGKIIDGQILRRQQGNAFVLERGVIGIGQSARLPERGLTVFVTQDKLDLDLWRRFLANGNGAAAHGETPAVFLPSLIVLQSDALTAFGRTFNDVNLRLRPDGTRWRMQIAAREAVGDITWDGGGQGSVSADLKRLRLDAAERAGQPAEASAALDSLPGMDIKIGDLTIAGHRLGRLELLAENGGGRWNLRRIDLENPDARLTGSGLWETGKRNHTTLDFTLNASDSGALLGRLGYPGMLRGGTAKLKGRLDWNGAPSEFDPASLGGALNLEAAKGQFSKVEPGVGKLLGLLSLQSITRRLTLDFHDIFSDGFAYDSIVAKFRIEKGVMRTDGDLRLSGPAGQVVMSGSVDLDRETQDLVVTVQPEVTGVTAVGAAVALHPVVGAAALLAQKLMKDPLNKALAYRYKVTGSWEQPQVEKLGMAPSLPVP